MKLVELPIAIDPAVVADFARAHRIRTLALFGSVTRNDFGPDSDVDVLVEYLPGQHPGLMLFEQQEALGRLLGRVVDLHTPASLSPFFRSQVLASAVPIYGHS